MKKLMTILGAFLCVSILLVSCGNEDNKKKKEVITPESEAKKYVDECMCAGMDLMSKAMGDPNNEDLQKEVEELEVKCEKLQESMESKYGNPDDPKDGDDAKKFWEAFKVEVEKECK